MGIHDRDYYRSDAPTNPFSALTRTAVSTLIAVNVGVWIIELLFDPAARLFLSATPRGLTEFRVYEILTAPFTHSTDNLFHLAWNMLFLYFFGRELEQIYGKVQFTIFYIAAGSLSVLAEVICLWLAGLHDVHVLGASGAVMGVVVLFTLFYPQRQILFMFFLPLPVWVLCAMFILKDLMEVFSQGVSNGVANFAHLAGAGVGFLYWYLDFRSRSLTGLFQRWKQGWQRRSRRRASHRTEAQILQMPSQTDEATRKVSQRIDELLEKISSDGKESLTEEEWQFLRENSNRYRS